MKKSRRAWALPLCALPLLGLGACQNTPKAHEAITFCAPGRSVIDFMDVVHETDPDIVFEVDPYGGQNGTAYMKGQLSSGEMPDVYSVSYLPTDESLLSERLIDLSGYDFTGNYVPARLREVNQSGAVYLLPSFYSCIGITYNKKILADNGWTLPTSFEELEELAPKVKAKGYRLALNELGLPGYGFQYLCNILDTSYLSTVNGKKWQSDFLSGKATLEDTPEMKEAIQLLQRWKDIGMLNDEMQGAKDPYVCEEMAKGNTLFLLGSTNSVGERGADVNDFGLMPYLSLDGKQNVYIMQVSRYMGLSKKLLEKGNEQKLKDALRVMEILSTQEGMEALNKSYVTTNLSPLKQARHIEGNFYNDIIQDIDAGYTAPFIYNGWDNVIAPYGNEVISFIQGEKSLSEVISYIDENQHLITNEESFTTVTETLSNADCAKLVGIAFTKATGSDFALLSLQGMDPETGSTNSSGVNGKLFPLPLGENEVCSICPTGWHGNIKTVTLTGKRILELASLGYDGKNNGYYFPYSIQKPDGFEIEENKTYKIVIAGATEEVATEGSLQDSGVLGMSALEDYLSKFDTLSPSLLSWN